MAARSSLACVPNFSTADPDVVRSILASAEEATVLDVHSDPDHGRTVVTLAAEPEPLVRSVAAMCIVAADRIDMSAHRGVHPCTGAADVVPFVPVDGTNMAHAKDAALELSSLMRRAGISHHLYGAATDPVRQLPDVRRALGRSEQPDFVGGRQQAGVTIIGAREPLVAFNVDLATGDPAPARRMAARVRDGEIRALGFALPSRGISQMSMNLIRPDSATMPVAYERVRREAESEGVAVLGAELVGVATRASTGGQPAASYGLAQEPKILEDLIDALTGRGETG